MKETDWSFLDKLTLSQLRRREEVILQQIQAICDKVKASGYDPAVMKKYEQAKINLDTQMYALIDRIVLKV